MQCNVMNYVCAVQHIGVNRPLVVEAVVTSLR